MSNRAEQTLHFVGEEAKKVAAKTLIYFFIGAAVLAIEPLRERLAAIWNSPAQLDLIERELRDVRSTLIRATGEDRVIRQPAGMTYVLEPVREGEPVVMNLVLQRTTLGAQCRFLGGVSLFTDQTGITLAGSQVVVQRQISRDPARIRVELQAPSLLQPGRVEVQLGLEYDCGGVITYDRTDISTFRLLPREITQ